MTKLIQFAFLTWLLGNPLLALAALFIVWWAVDRYTFGFLPDPVRWWRRRARVGILRRILLQNPHDRRARLELADLLATRRPAEAMELLKPNLAAGDDDPETLFTMGVACFGAGHPDQAEVFLAEAAGRDPKFRQGAVDLELGRGRLAKGDAAGAKAALEAFCATRVGSVEGKVLLAKAHDGLGESAEAAALREAAWADFVAAPRFQRRRERLWAWRAKPSRPVIYAAVLLGVALVTSQVLLPAIADSVGSSVTRPSPGRWADPGDPDVFP